MGKRIEDIEGIGPSLGVALRDVNAEKTLVRKTPIVKMVEAWIEQANTLPEKISH